MRPPFSQLPPASAVPMHGDSAGSLPVSSERDGVRPQAWWRALRPHQWIKNLLVFTPVFTSHQLGVAASSSAAGYAALAFCLCASGMYLLNDARDLAYDRAHPVKRSRPLAAGLLDTRRARIVGCGLALAGTAAGALHSLLLAAVLVGYVAWAFAYTQWIKALRLADVVVLACLYVLRIVAGHAATGIEYSPWLLTFAFLVFFTLALAKRRQEIQVAGVGRVAGRAYGPSDLPWLTYAAALSGIGAAIVLGFYIGSENARRFYRWPALLLACCPVLLGWFWRIWRLCGRDRSGRDSIILALADPISLSSGAAMLAIVALATESR